LGSQIDASEQKLWPYEPASPYGTYCSSGGNAGQSVISLRLIQWRLWMKALGQKTIVFAGDKNV